MRKEDLSFITQGKQQVPVSIKLTLLSSALSSVNVMLLLCKTAFMTVWCKVISMWNKLDSKLKHAVRAINQTQKTAQITFSRTLDRTHWLCPTTWWTDG